MQRIHHWGHVYNFQCISNEIAIIKMALNCALKWC